MNKAWQAYARHILDAIGKIERIQQRGDLSADEVLYAASLRHLQTLSEATQRLPESLKQARPSVPWNQIAGFRNILVHNYLGDIDPLTVLAVVQRHLPPLKEVIQDMLTIDPGKTESGDR